MIRVSAPWLRCATAADTGEAELRMGQPGVTRNAPEVCDGSTADAHGRQANFFIRWFPSRTLREAAARNDVQTGHAKQEEASSNRRKFQKSFKSS